MEINTLLSEATDAVRVARGPFASMPVLCHHKGAFIVYPESDIPEHALCVMGMTATQVERGLSFHEWDLLGAALRYLQKEKRI